MRKVTKVNSNTIRANGSLTGLLHQFFLHLNVWRDDAF